jgi:hypothetical protein
MRKVVEVGRWKIRKTSVSVYEQVIAMACKKNITAPRRMARRAMLACENEYADVLEVKLVVSVLLSSALEEL